MKVWKCSICSRIILKLLNITLYLRLRYANYQSAKGSEEPGPCSNEGPTSTPVSLETIGENDERLSPWRIFSRASCILYNVQWLYFSVKELFEISRHWSAAETRGLSQPTKYAEDRWYRILRILYSVSAWIPFKEVSLPREKHFCTGPRDLSSIWTWM